MKKHKNKKLPVVLLFIRDFYVHVPACLSEPRVESWQNARAMKEKTSLLANKLLRI